MAGAMLILTWRWRYPQLLNYKNYNLKNLFFEKLNLFKNGHTLLH